jgi:DNA-binding winged helix-turn-helix (wHTH) protein/predicted ATPase
MRYTFGDCALETQLYTIQRAEQVMRLRPKVFQVLLYLLEQRHRVVPKEELAAAIWPALFISDATVESTLRAVRRALGDTGRTQCLIQTLPGYGYRFAAAVTWDDHPPDADDRPSTPPVAATLARPMVGRQAELQYLHQWLAAARRGERQCAWVMGEPGIGKTTVVDAFVQQLAGVEAVSVARGQCVQHFGEGEAYLPVLAALGQLARESGQHPLLNVLHQYAPTWLVQMPALLCASDRDTLQRQTQGATQARMLREMAEALEALTADRVLVLVLEDLQWSDASTLTLVSFLARRHPPARLLVVGTFRPLAGLAAGHPLRAVIDDLQIHQQCHALPLGLFSAAEVGAYLTARFGDRHPDDPAVPRLVHLLHQRTEGNPLFLVLVVDTLVTQGVLGAVPGGWELWQPLQEDAVRVPETLRQMIEQQLSQVGPAEQAVVEAASVAGREFAAAAVAAGVDTAVDAVEEVCETLARRGQFVQGGSITEWPDGTLATGYRFLHTLYQEVVYDRIPLWRRIHLHRRIGARQEQAYGVRASEVAAVLAVHFERGRAYHHAVAYREQAAQHALRQFAAQEAIEHLRKGLALLQTLPETPEGRQQERALHVALSVGLILTQGYTAPEVEAACTRARTLCQDSGDVQHLCAPLYGLYLCALFRGQLHAARELADQLVALAQQAADAARLSEAYCTVMGVAFHAGEFTAAAALIAHSLALAHPDWQGSMMDRYGDDPGVIYRSYGALVLWIQGYPDQALQRSQDALAVARQRGHPFSQIFALTFAAFFHQFRREAPRTQEQAEAAIRLATAQGFPFWFAMGMIMRGWALAAQGQRAAGMAQLHQGLAAYQATGAQVWWSYFLGLQADVQGQGGQADAGLHGVEDALALAGTAGEQPWYEAEIHRHRGERGLAHAGTRHMVEDAAACLLQAVGIARRQEAKSLELRAATSLARLWQQQGKRAEAHALLSPIYGWFTEGFDTADLQEAKMLLEELGR